MPVGWLARWLAGEGGGLTEEGIGLIYEQQQAAAAALRPVKRLVQLQGSAGGGGARAKGRRRSEDGLHGPGHGRRVVAEAASATARAEPGPAAGRSSRPGSRAAAWSGERAQRGRGAALTWHSVGSRSVPASQRCRPEAPRHRPTGSRSPCQRCGPAAWQPSSCRCRGGLRWRARRSGLSMPIGKSTQGWAANKRWRGSRGVPAARGGRLARRCCCRHATAACRRPEQAAGMFLRWPAAPTIKQHVSEGRAVALHVGRQRRQRAHVVLQGEGGG